MLKLIKKTEQLHSFEVDGQPVTFTVRPAVLADLDLAYVTAMDGVEQVGDLALGAKDSLFALKAGREMLLQRIGAWEGVWLSDTDPAPCTREYLEAFFVQYPQIFQQLSAAVRDRDEDVIKN